jgi:hypothetical protein
VAAELKRYGLRLQDVSAVTTDVASALRALGPAERAERAQRLSRAAVLLQRRQALPRAEQAAHDPWHDYLAEEIHAIERARQSTEAELAKELAREPSAEGCVRLHDLHLRGGESAKAVAALEQLGTAAAFVRPARLAAAAAAAGPLASTSVSRLKTKALKGLLAAGRGAEARVYFHSLQQRGMADIYQYVAMADGCEDLAELRALFHRKLLVAHPASYTVLHAVWLKFDEVPQHCTSFRLESLRIVLAWMHQAEAAVATLADGAACGALERGKVSRLLTSTLSSLLPEPAPEQQAPAAAHLAALPDQYARLLRIGAAAPARASGAGRERWLQLGLPIARLSVVNAATAATAPAGEAYFDALEQRARCALSARRSTHTSFFFFKHTHTHFKNVMLYLGGQSLGVLRRGAGGGRAGGARRPTAALPDARPLRGTRAGTNKRIWCPALIPTPCILSVPEGL